MATQFIRPSSRLRGGGAQRVKVHDENALKEKPAPSAPTIGGAKRIPLLPTKANPTKATTTRSALGEITAKVISQKNILTNNANNGKQQLNDITKVKRTRTASLVVSSGAQRVPIQNHRTSLQEKKRTSVNSRPTSKVPELVSLPQEEEEEEQILVVPPPTSDVVDMEDVLSEEEEELALEVLPESGTGSSLNSLRTGAQKALVWPALEPSQEQACAERLGAIRASFQEEIDLYDTTMVSEYSEDILCYMGELELSTMPKGDYILSQTEITWEMREMLVDWMCQAHLRYHMLPETLWISINIVDRFLSLRSVSLVKLQLVGITALFIAAKYEEILAPTVDEFVYITENQFSKEEILKGERIVLQTLEFRVSHYCSPYTWVRRISKADDYDLQTRTLSKFLMEVTLLDHRFLPAKPSLVAAVGMYSARKILGGGWSDPFVYYSGFAEQQLLTGHHYLIERMADQRFLLTNICKKYAQKKFLKASLFAVEWAKDQAISSPVVVSPTF